MKRIRRVSIEVEQSEITLYATSSSRAHPHPQDQNPSSAEPAAVVPKTKVPPEELAVALTEGRVHLHRNADGHITVCAREGCDD